MIRLCVFLALVASGCCCPIELDLGPLDPEPEDRARSDDDDRPRKKDRRGREEVDLGTAEHPAGNGSEPALHPWQTPRVTPSRYRLGYRLEETRARRILGDYHSFADRLGHRAIDEHRFQWRPEKRCLGGLHCVYEELDGQNREGVAPLARLFVARARAANLDTSDAAELVFTFVQHIRYEIPKEQPFGVLPPALVVKEKRGDCDSKSLLAHMILREMGIRTVLVSSQAHAHTMLGVALPAPGRSFTWRGTKWAFLETTAKGAPLGYIDPKLLRPNDWQVVEMHYGEGASRGATGVGRSVIETTPGRAIEIR